MSLMFAQCYFKQIDKQGGKILLKRSTMAALYVPSPQGGGGIKPHMMDVSGVMQGAAGRCQGNAGSGGDGELHRAERTDLHLHCCVSTHQRSQLLFLCERLFSRPLEFHLGQANWVCNELKGWVSAASRALGPAQTGFYLQAFYFWLSAWFSPRKERNRSRLSHPSLWRSTLSPCKFVLRLLPADVCFAEQE